MSKRIAGSNPEIAHNPAEVPVDQPFDYHILHSPELRVQYLHHTDELIRKMVGQGTEVAIYLDKSARPVAWLVHELWDLLAPRNGDGTIPEEPTIKFLNIDREQWGAVIGRTESKDDVMDVGRVPADRMQELRDVFKPLTGNDQEKTFSLLTGKKVMVVDEVSVSGDTLKMSKGILERAFPDAADIESNYWMSGKVRLDSRSSMRVNTELPIWYSDRESTGRLVADRDTTKSQASNSERQRIGRFWLSTTFRTPDQKGLQLRREVRQMAQDLREHRLLYKPAPLWSMSKIEKIGDRVLRLNGLTIDQYTALRQNSSDDAAMQRNYDGLRESAAK